LGDLGEEGGVGDDEAEVDVDWRGDAGLELEVTELHGRDLVELEDQGLHRRRGCHSLGTASGLYVSVRVSLVCVGFTGLEWGLFFYQKNNNNNNNNKI